MKKISTIIMTSIMALALVGCGQVNKGYEQASLVTNSSEQQQIIEKVTAVSFESLNNCSIAIKAQAKITIATLELSGNYTTRNWGSENASTNYSIKLDKPISQQMISGSGNGHQVSYKTEEISIPLAGTLLQASESTSNALYDTSDPATMEISLLAQLAGLEKEDFSQIRKLASGGQTTYYIDAKKETMTELIQSFGLHDMIAISSDPIMGFTMSDTNNELKGISINFQGTMSNFAMEFALQGTISR